MSRQVKVDSTLGSWDNRAFIGGGSGWCVPLYVTDPLNHASELSSTTSLRGLLFSADRKSTLQCQRQGSVLQAAEQRAPNGSHLCDEA